MGCDLQYNFGRKNDIDVMTVEKTNKIKFGCSGYEIAALKAQFTVFVPCIGLYVVTNSPKSSHFKIFSLPWKQYLRKKTKFLTHSVKQKLIFQN